MQDQFVGMFQEEWRDSKEYERRQEEIEMEHMDPESYLSCEPVAVSKSQVPSPRCSPPRASSSKLVSGRRFSMESAAAAAEEARRRWRRRSKRRPRS